jgi:uncharacterized protein (TIGR01777 family)
MATSLCDQPHVLVTGASGLVGRALVPVLAARGCRVTRVVHRRGGATNDLVWNAEHGMPDFPDGAYFDAVIHLAGANVAAGRWTTARRAVIHETRVAGTRRLAEGLARLTAPPRVLVSAGAIGYYGDRGDEVLAESAGPGSGFLAETCLAWEHAVAAAARNLGARCVIGRLGMVLSGEGGVLGKLLPPFRAGLGGPLGDGKQWVSWVSAPDVVAMLVAAVYEQRWQGPVNFVAPGVVTNAAFTAALARLLHRPAILPVPRWLLRMAVGGMADEMLLASARVAPQALATAGFQWEHPQLDSALRAALGLRAPVAAGSGGD